MFEPLLNKVFILRMRRGEILEQSDNPRKLPSYIKLSRPQKLKREDLSTFTGSCKAIFQGQIPLKNKDLGSFHSIEKLSIKEARYSLGEDTNSIPTCVIGKLEKNSGTTINFHSNTCKWINKKFR